MNDKIVFLDKDGVLHISLSERLDEESASKARNAIDAAIEKSKPKQVNIDLSKLIYLIPPDLPF